MTNYYGINNFSVPKSGTALKAEAKAPLSKPIEIVQNTIESVTDQIIPVEKDEKKKKARKTAITVGSSVLVLSALIGILNPRYSSKFAGKLKNWQQKAHSKVKTHRGDDVKKWFYQAYSNVLDFSTKSFNVINNMNSFKDMCFQWMCAKPRSFSGMENKEVGNALRKINSGIATILRKPYNAITRGFDNISKATVRMKYKQAAKKMDSFEKLVREYAQKLPADKKAEFDAKFKELQTLREYFAQDNIKQRLLNQENIMSNLEEDFTKKCISYKNGFRNQFIKRTDHMRAGTNFWAEDIMRPQRDILEHQGNLAVEKITGKVGGDKGVYNELLEILKTNLGKDELAQLETSMNKANKVLQKANYSECIEYFDKKRDLILGSAPTDILTALVGLGLSGYALSTADNKEQRITRLTTGIFPVVAGLGASMVFTSMLISGSKSLLMGAGTSAILSGIGSFANRQILGNNNTENQEVGNA